MLLELHSFAGKSEILGVVREVAFANGILSIGVGDMASARLVLKALETGGLLSMDPSDKLVPRPGNGAPRAAEQDTGAAPASVVPSPAAAASPAASLAVPAPAPARSEMPEAPGDDALVARVRAMTRLRAVFEAVREAGAATPAELLAVCERIQSRVDLLGRVDNLGRRVEAWWATSAPA